MADNSGITQQQVSIGFNDRPYVPCKYVFEMDDRVDEDQTLAGVVRIRKYPAYAPGTWSPVGTPFYFDQSINLVVTEGSIASTQEVRDKEVYGSLVVNGDASAQLPYPVVRGMDFYIDGSVFDIRGNEITVNVAFDSIKNAFVFSRPCYCVIKYSYVTQYQILRYFPNTYNDYETYYMPDPNDYGQLLGFVRVPVGIDPIAPIIFSIAPPEGISAEFELYRVESTAIVNTNGLWEKPLGWPTDGSYPNSTKMLDITGSNIEIARTHEIGYFSLLNNARRMEAYASASAESLPLDFSKRLALSDSAGSDAISIVSMAARQGDSEIRSMIATSQKVQQKEHFDKYRRLLNRAPKMRTVHYDIPIGEPYKSTTAVNSAREVVRSIATRKVVDPQGATQSQKIINESLVTFRIKLTVKAPTRPTVSAAVVRNQSNANSVDYNTQALRINTMLSMVWEGVDWKKLRARIKASYDPDIYQVVFDSSIPS